MASVFTPPNIQQSHHFQWYWNSSPNPWSGVDEEWQMYMHDKNKTIEDAYNAGKSQIEIDDNYVIDLEYLLQYNKIDNSNTRQIKRVQLESDHRNVHQLEERFSSPILLVPETSLIQESDLEEDTLEYLQKYGDFPDAYYEQELYNKDKTFADVIDQAIEGILKEGMSLGKEIKARQLSEQLLAVKHFGINIIPDRFNLPPEVGETCVRLYTMDSFWFHLINRITRNPATITREHIKTLGPFCYLLELYLMKFSTNDIKTVYRGVYLTDEQRQEFMKQNVVFKSFTSTSRNRAIAEMFGNTLLIIDLNIKDPQMDGNMNRGADISPLSQFSVEEEFLVWPSAEFTFVDYKYDAEIKKHIIYLKSAELKWN
ncbi:unnamed protein product [Rotaria sordida]|uniref:NAD(P)(+)--arginine ADP-ribosyltransferase n=1 Tax=Rotaria sordida TaxID=392033 RepID=A0A815V8K9_9BILA|nr:unnamed protein product [Rotaria sordida]CAF1664044.1 unnamed protein product [Rotaria sordida]